ncbi:MAG TPA: aromatic amino acid ammonia-lyase [Microbacterium sp.]|nr:aromatic amino acid ammonia-lyase [Microbacterium sp.]
MTILDGTALTIDDVLRVGAHAHPQLEIADDARERVAASWMLADELAGSRPVYGRTTGVGANRDTTVAQDVSSDLRLLRSHATGSGRPLPAATVRMALLIRLNQLLRGGSGIHPDAVDALRTALTADRIPAVHAAGAIGTGDLSALGEIALALLGDDAAEHPAALWRPHAGDALPFLSSNAVTIAAACAEIARLRHWQRRHAFVAALSFLAVRASRESLQPSVHAARPQNGQAEAASSILTLLADCDLPARRVQDSYGFRAYPQVTGALLDAAAGLEHVIGVDIVSASENPLIDLESRDAFHNGNFHGIPLALAADRVKLALTSVGQLSVARLTDISDPDMTGLTSFLADTPGGSGVMLLEYNQAAAQADLRQNAQPATLGSVVISRGVENHSSFSTQAVGQLRRCLDAAYDVLACELVAAIRALELHGDRIAGPLATFVQSLAPLVDHDPADRPLTADLAAARTFLESHPITD